MGSQYLPLGLMYWGFCPIKFENLMMILLDNIMKCDRSKSQVGTQGTASYVLVI